ncbi:MAG: ABC transporter ATP-binding protein [Bdellovibrionales bacterium]|nr:ABC transporter ATP-binding protein [Bdellovibrionales bacterium]
MKPGEIFGLLGPNGAGKTSIISCLVTLQEPTSGHCEIFGYDPKVNPEYTKVLTGFVPQELINHGFFSIEEILVFHSGFYQRWHNKERIHYLLKRLGLWEHKDKKVKALSGGMKRRLLIAKALVHEPKLLLLDEPTAGVDIELRASLWDFVQELSQDGMSILLTTHYLEEAESLCDRVGILQNGNLRTVGPTRELIEKLTERKVHVFFDGVCNEEISSPYLRNREDNQAEFVIPHGVGVGDLIADIQCNVHKILDIKIEEGSLEEAFVHVLGEHQ